MNCFGNLESIFNMYIYIIYICVCVFVLCLVVSLSKFKFRYGFAAVFIGFFHILLMFMFGEKTFEFVKTSTNNIGTLVLNHHEIGR